MLDEVVGKEEGVCRGWGLTSGNSKNVSSSPLKPWMKQRRSVWIMLAKVNKATLSKFSMKKAYFARFWVREGIVRPYDPAIVV